MGERRFVLFEDDMTGYNSCHQQSITETELKRRLDKMGCLAMDEQIDILLHGDGEKGEERKYPCSDCGKLLTAAEGGSTFTVCEECWDKGKVVTHPTNRNEIDMDTKTYREKYGKRTHGRNLAYPPGGADVQRLCDAVDRLTQLVRDIQTNLPTDIQNEVERRLWNI